MTNGASRRITSQPQRMKRRREVAFSSTHNPCLFSPENLGPFLEMFPLLVLRLTLRPTVDISERTRKPRGSWVSLAPQKTVITLAHSLTMRGSCLLPYYRWTLILFLLVHLGLLLSDPEIPRAGRRPYS